MKETQQHIERLWKSVYATGIGDVCRGLHFLSHLFILKYLEERSVQLGVQDTTFLSAEAEAAHWCMIKNMALTDAAGCCQHLRQRVGPWLASQDSGGCLQEAPYVFAQVLPVAIYKLMDAIDLVCEDSLSILDAFELVLAWAEKEGAFQPTAGQIMTPAHIASLMMDLVRPQPDERFMDASCGTGNLLVAAHQHMQIACNVPAWYLANGRMLFNPEEAAPYTPTLFGYDYETIIPPITYAHALLSGVAHPQIQCSDALGSVFNQKLAERAWGELDVICGNPPYNGHLDLPDLGETLKNVGTRDTELLFVELTMQLLREGGRSALLLPEGVVRNASKAAIELRRKLVQEHYLQAVISLPPGIFLPLTNVKTSMLVFQKRPPTDASVLFYRVGADGFTFDARRQEVPAQNDLWDLRCQFAAALDQPAPAPVLELMSLDWWTAYTAGDPSRTHVIPVTTTRDIDPISGKPVPAFQQVTSFVSAPVEEERSWFVSFDEIEERSFSLCADTYREPALPMSRRKGRLR